MYRFIPIFLAATLVGCGNSNDNSTPTTTSANITVNGAGVKGPLVNAEVNLYQLDLTSSTLEGDLIAEASTDSTAAITGLTVPDDITGNFILEFSVDSDTFDLNTGEAPIFERMVTVVSAEELLDEKAVYATPITTIVVDMAAQNADSGSPYSGNDDGSISEEEFLAALEIAENQIKSSFGFGMPEDLDIFTVPPLVTDETDTPEELSAVASYRQTVEAFSAVIKELTDTDDGLESPQEVLDALTEDLSDGKIDGKDGDEEIAELSSLTTPIDEAINNINLDDLTVPGTDHPISDIEDLLVDEKETTGVETNTDDLESGEVEVELEPINTVSDSDNDGVNDDEDAFPSDSTESADNDQDHIGDNADTDDDNDNVADENDAFPFNPEESIDTDNDGIGNNEDTNDDNDDFQDSDDAFPLDDSESTDTDDDGIGDNADTDDDNDNVLDVNDAFPFDPTESVDTDNDGIGNNEDEDDDGDQVPDDQDAFPEDPERFEEEEEETGSAANILTDWLINDDQEFSAHIGGGSILVNVQSVTDTVLGNEAVAYIEASGIPDYQVTMTDNLVEWLDDRPNASSDFRGNGKTSATSGEIYDFGEDINYSSSGCDVGEGYGYWPPGPGCPEDLTKEVYLPQEPEIDAEASCALDIGAVGYAVNGVSIYGWTDGSSYNSQGSWQNLAAFAEVYDVDICGGHAANGDYHHHFYSSCWADSAGEDFEGHSELYGFAADGYPVYGPYEDTGELAQTCWVERNYDGGPTADDGWGCVGVNGGEAGERTCALDDQYAPTTVVAADNNGPDTDETVFSLSQNSFTASSGFYYEDYYFDSSCEGESGLDKNSGHSDEVRGYHYHLPLSEEPQDNVLPSPAFPFVFGPTFAGVVDAANSGAKCASSSTGNMGGGSDMPSLP